MAERNPGKIYILFIFYFLFLWGGQLSAALSSQQDSAFNLYVIILYICFLSRAVIWFQILRKTELIKAYTLSSLNFLIIPLLSLIVLGEPLQLKHLFGGLFIASGIILFGMGEQKSTILLREGKTL